MNGATPNAPYRAAPSFVAITATWAAAVPDYRVTEQAIEVLRIYRGAQDGPEKLRLYRTIEIPEKGRLCHNVTKVPFWPCSILYQSARNPDMDEQTLNAIAHRELQEDMRRAEERAVFIGLLERDSDGTLTITDEGENHFWAWLHSQPTLH